MARLKHAVKPLAQFLWQMGHPAGFAMARLKRMPRLTKSGLIQKRSPGGIRDGAIETLVRSVRVVLVFGRHPAGFAMARLKPFTGPSRLIKHPIWSPGGIRDGAIETWLCFNRAMSEPMTVTRRDSRWRD